MVRRSVLRRVVLALGGVGVVFLALWLSLARPAVAQEGKKFPPYPDVWGYELPWGYPTYRSAISSTAKMPNGDYLVTYITGRGKAEDQWIFSGLAFFAGTKITFTRDEFKEFWRTHHVDRVGVQLEIVLSDGSKIGRAEAYPCGNCCPWFSSFLQRLDKAGKVVWRKHLIYLRDKPLQREVDRYCEHNWGRDWGRQAYISTYVEGMGGRLARLEDDTFLLLEAGGNLVLRFDKDLGTKSDLVGTKVFIVERSEMEDLLGRLPKDHDQARVDAVYRFLKDRRRGEKR